MPVVRCWSEVSLGGSDDVVLGTRVVVRELRLARGCPERWDEALLLWLASNPWPGEFQWSRSSLRE